MLCPAFKILYYFGLKIGRILLVFELLKFCFLTIFYCFGVSSSGKTRAFGARIRRFESYHPSHEARRERKWLIIRY